MATLKRNAASISAQIQGKVKIPDVLTGVISVTHFEEYPLSSELGEILYLPTWIYYVPNGMSSAHNSLTEPTSENTTHRPSI